MRSPLRTDYGGWGQNETFDYYNAYVADCMSLIEAGINPKTRKPFEGALLEAFQAGRSDILEADGRADFAAFLWEPIQAAFYQGYESIAGQFSQYTGKTTLTSFDIHRIKGQNGLKGVAYVGENGEYVDLERSFRPEAGLAAETYGGTYHLTRKLLRSNGADKVLSTLPQDLGAAIADFITQLVIAFIVANPNAPDGSPMFSSGRGNLVTTALSETSYFTMAAWLGTRKDPDGRPIRNSVKYAVTQNALPAGRLMQILDSMSLQLTGVSTTAQSDVTFGRGTMNPIPKLPGTMSSSDIVIDPYLPDAEDVYFMGDPNRLAAFTVGYLDGEERPFLGQEDSTVMHLSNSNGSGFDPYTLQADLLGYKGRHDIGVQAIEPLGAYLMSPA